MKTLPSSLDVASLPEGLRSHGMPLSVHRPWKAVIADLEAKTLSRLLGKYWQNLGKGPQFQTAMFLGGGVFGLLAGLVVLWIFLYRPPVAEDAHFVLVAAGIFFALASY